ncbi:GNAT family N-acetyltransferase [Mycobacterium sp. 21AC1]|uniref:GNAT family N-acetyltransferase n=1 Tax=[Mycobacterium] appelbergii TaxID=2939269 RepID=UPI00293949F0|nr:GNAT family N-acetyltransferase [Mycobacterium sp. 21AC1]MDV3124267.1 GNAT family N-acetyltransferase [Mycobacterium sp. 21AC1]
MRGLVDHLPVTQDGVTVRQLRHADAAAFAAGTKDPQVRRYGHLPLSDYTPEIVLNQIDGIIAEGMAAGTLAVLAIADAASEMFLGSIVLFDIRGDRAEVGFWLTPDARGRGAARSALVAIARLAADAGIPHLDARTVVDNAGSRRVLEGAGFRQVGGASTDTAPSGETVVSVKFECDPIQVSSCSHNPSPTE